MQRDLEELRKLAFALHQAAWDKTQLPEALERLSMYIGEEVAREAEKCNDGK